MFVQSVLRVAIACAYVAGTLARPLEVAPVAELATRGSSMSFNNWGGFSSLSNFDDFYGIGNFDNFHFTQVIEQETEVVCHSQRIEIIQQQLVVLQEMAKKIVTEQICEVETQTIVFQQFQSSMSSFSDDLLRSSGRHVGYDSNIVQHYGSIINSDGSFTGQDLGFSGHDVGAHSVVVGGNNWNGSTSPDSVERALNASKAAISANN